MKMYLKVMFLELYLYLFSAWILNLNLNLNSVQCICIRNLVSIFARVAIEILWNWTELESVLELDLEYDLKSV